MQAIVNFVSEPLFLPIILSFLIILLLVVVCLVTSIRSGSPATIPFLWCGLTLALIFSDFTSYVLKFEMHSAPKIDGASNILSIFYGPGFIIIIPIIFALFYCFYSKIRQRIYRNWLAFIQWAFFAAGSLLLSGIMLYSSTSPMPRRYSYMELQELSNLIKLVAPIILVTLVLSFIFFVLAMIFTRKNIKQINQTTE